MHRIRHLIVILEKMDKISRREIEVQDLLAEISAEARGFVTAANQTLDVRCEERLKNARLKVDSGRLRHVFINLLTNAVKYSPPGGTVTLSASDAPLGFVQFSVRDQGAGIPAESVPHVFDRFYRAPDQTKTGAGLGLAISREIVVAHGGTIACSSQVGVGTEFHFLLPR